MNSAKWISYTADQRKFLNIHPSVNFRLDDTMVKKQHGRKSLICFPCMPWKFLLVHRPHTEEKPTDEQYYISIFSTYYICILSAK